MATSESGPARSSTDGRLTTLYRHSQRSCVSRSKLSRPSQGCHPLLVSSPTRHHRPSSRALQERSSAHCCHGVLAELVVRRSCRKERLWAGESAAVALVLPDSHNHLWSLPAASSSHLIAPPWPARCNATGAVSPLNARTNGCRDAASILHFLRFVPDPAGLPPYTLAGSWRYAPGAFLSQQLPETVLLVQCLNSCLKLCC